MDNKKVSPGMTPGRRKSGGSTQLRSPVVKRPTSAPVALQGWLYKQGSEGLMLWKKRWFVLSEYCLFYYKGPEEEKLLGSILLPSYKISPCTNDDKVYKKFAFKAEHANMRTYYFAADSRELMVQWMNALSLASILQEGGNLQYSHSLNHTDDSDAGFRGYRQRTNPIITQPTNDMNGWVPQYPLRGIPQPLYANAPPKPKRLNEGHYGSSSPEMSPDRRLDELDNKIYNNSRVNYDQIWSGAGRNYHYHPPMGQVPVQRTPYSNIPSPSSSSTVHTGTFPGADRRTPDPFSRGSVNTPTGTYPGIERRTPDPFGRGNVTPTGMDRRTPEMFGRNSVNTPTIRSQKDYSDVYKGYSQSYQRPEAPNVPDYVRTVNPPIITYQNQVQYYQRQPSNMSSTMPNQGLELSNKKLQPPRPHSADFLDYDSKKWYEYQEYKQTTIVEKTDVKMLDRRPRPKSSLDIVSTNDNYYLSEESYAEKMRQSALYLQNTLPLTNQHQSSRSNKIDIRQIDQIPVGPGSGLSDSSSVVIRSKSREFEQDRYQQKQQRRWSETPTQFLRSASARLAKQQDEESDEIQAYTGGEDFKIEDKREESMKRLLEWKQRMLQSPLTRKSSGSANRGTSHNELSKFYKQQVLMELEKQEARNLEELGRKRVDERIRSRSSDGRRCASAVPTKYNSYSSDDEEKNEARRKRTRRPLQRRQSNEDTRNRRSPSARQPFTSPDYENIDPEQDKTCIETSSLLPYVKYSKTAKAKNLEIQKLPEDNFKHSDSGYDTLKTKETHSNEENKIKWKKESIQTEFSYEYLNPDNATRHKLETPPENIVKSRIKQLGLEVKEDEKNVLMMKEPLKVSPPYQPNEALVSTLKHQENELDEKSIPIRKFALGETPTQGLEDETKCPKSVKDLLADFERKSQLAQEKQAAEKNEESKRCVFSDTETLLYDTSSDNEGKKNEFNSKVFDNLRRADSRIGKDCSDDDEEVAAALGRRERFFSSCRDLGRKRETEHYKRKIKTKSSVNNDSPNMESIVTPGYLRSSLADSVVTHSDSSASTPIIDQIKESLHKNLSKENFEKEVSQDGVEMLEGHYMPMTPSRKVSAQNSDRSRSNSSLHSVLFNADVEETYVEMTETVTNSNEPNKSFLSSLKKKHRMPDDTHYDAHNNSSDTHYDFLYRTSSQHEPEYMEVNNLLEILKEQDEQIKEHKERVNLNDKLKDLNKTLPPSRAALPDILNSSSTAQVTKSDSSDADDESSKDLDSLDTPRHPRFSLSDTFRPASYYLGNTMNVTERNLIGISNPTENQDSSDSDLVSPPPIPTSPPPMDDLDTSLEHDSFYDNKGAPKNGSGNVWTGDDNTKLSQVEARRIDLLLKRRPVSGELIETLHKSDLEQSFSEKHPGSDLESIGSRSGLVLDHDNESLDIDRYLEELQISESVNAHLYSKGLHERFDKSYPKESSKNLMSIQDKSSMEKELIFNPTERNTDPDNQYENLQVLFPPPPPELYESSNDQSDREGSLPLPEDLPPPSRYRSETDRPEPVRVCFDPNTLMQHGDEMCQSLGENQGAPYYYSDILKPDEDGFTSSTSDRSLSTVRGNLGHQPLNNQRDDIQESILISKRNDIGRKVNPINQSISKTEIEEVDYVQKIAAELRQTSVHFMGAADKSDSVDVRNLYEADTLRRKTTYVPESDFRIRTPDLNHPQGIARNLYPHGLRDKSSSPKLQQTHDLNFLMRNRSRSLEGLLDEQDIFQANRSNIQQSPEGELRIRANTISHSNAVSSNAVPETRIDIYEGDDLWEQDALWRESLRRVSLRHTRSLDNLDEARAPTARLGEINAQLGETTLSPSRLSTGHLVNQTNETRISQEHLSYSDRTPVTSGRRSADHFPSSSTSIPTGRLSVDHFVGQNRPVVPTGRLSVDHFTNENRAAIPSGRLSVDHFTFKGRGKLSREVTYVNDFFKRPKDSEEYEQDYREGRIRPKKKENPRNFVELNDTALLEHDDGIHYERLARPNASRGREQTYLAGYEWDEDEETFRRNQREVEEKSPRARQPVSFLEDGNHPPQPPPSVLQETSLELIDREKLRQWDLMSSGMVESDHGQPSTTDTNQSEMSDETKRKEEDNQIHNALRKQPKPDLTPNSEASASGSVIRETNLPRSLSTQNVPPRQPIIQDERPYSTQDMRNYYSINPGSYNDGLRSTSGREYIDSNTYVDRRRGLTERMIQDVYDQDRGRNNYEYYQQSATLPNHKTSNYSNGIRNVATMDTRLGKENYHVSGKREKTSNGPWGLNVSAGELLGRTHEELVLLLIQLRRQSAGVCKAMEACHIEIEAQARLAELETPKRMEHLQKLEDLKRHLLELEKQYEKGKPLVNLVDNMVKLGSLYRGNNRNNNNSINVGLDQSTSSNVREKLEFNQKVQEQRLLAEERKDWDRLNPDHSQLQAKVQQLYRLDRLLQEESGTLHSLQQDKELLEKALSGLKKKLEVNRTNPIEAERYRRQQKLLEKELSRVRLLLAHNSKKLEETVAENARLEQELVILRQKLSSYSRSSNTSLVPDSATVNTTAALEAELRRVQQLVGDLQRQRQELSVQVKQLTERDDNLSQQIRPGPTGVAGAGPIPGKKRPSGTWLETDLDLLITQDVSTCDSPPHVPSPPKVTNTLLESTTVPIYINTDINNTKKSDMSMYETSILDYEISSPSEVPPDYPPPAPPPTESSTLSYCTPVELSEADDRMKRFYGIIPREKQEIKTVRIVKRESERRQRDRDRSGNIGIPIGNTATAKRVSVFDDTEMNGLSRVDEESYELTTEEPYKNFHPTNPFLPQNLVHVEDDPVLSQFQRSMSLPRGFGKREEPPPPPRNDSVCALRNMVAKRNRVRFGSANTDGSGSESSANSPRVDSPRRNYQPVYGVQSPRSCSPRELYGNRQLSAREQLFGVSEQYLSPEDEVSPQLSPIYQSEAAREIILEMSRSEGSSRRLQVPKEKRRHHTVSNIRLDNDSHFTKMGTARSRDDLDMERALRPRINTPDVVRSTMSQKDLKYNENTIDNILGTPNKIVIPERYIPEQEPLLSAEEQLQRLRKAESIRKMLSETTAVSSPELNQEATVEEPKSSTLKKKLEEEKRQREHLLQLNQILAQQVMEKSKLVAGSNPNASHHQQ